MKRSSLTATSVTAAALLVLWGASWGLSFVDLGAWSTAIALAIAAAKATLVVLVFMELLQERVSVHAALVAGLAMIAILIFFMVADVRTRAAPSLLPPLTPLSARQSPPEL